jgi:hypothetical protein
MPISIGIPGLMEIVAGMEEENGVHSRSSLELEGWKAKE